MDKGEFRNCSAGPVVMPRLMFGGTGSGCGKTTVTAAVLQALTARKMKLAPYKCGPDYIDPMFHRQITCLLYTSRVLDNEASKARCREIFEDENHWQAQMPPFDIEANRRFLKMSGAKALVTKDSGAAGGLPEKLEAARLEGVSVILIRRPEEKDILENLDRLDVYFT